jgi:hypothetical protein
MNRERERESRRNGIAEGDHRGAGRLTPPRASNEDGRVRKRRRSRSSDDDEEGDSRRKRKHREDEPKYSASSRGRERERERDRDKVKEKRMQNDSEDKRLKQKSRHTKHDRANKQRHENNSEEDHHRSHRKEESGHKHRRHRSHSRPASRSRSPDSRAIKRHKESSRQCKTRSPVPLSRSPERRQSKSTNGIKYSKPISSTLDSDSDPLEAIVGPLPPRAQPTVRSKGRGAHKANAMDERFSTTYNPSIDVRVNSDVEDDWGDALEALKDRQQYKQQGAERLKAAGFSEEQVKKWEKGDEKGEEDVKWVKRGEGREWDRGKVVDEDGDVELKAEWGRLT